MRYSILELEKKTFQYRKRFLELFTEIGFGHITSAFSWAEIATVLYHEIMDLPPESSDMSSYDKMVVSKGHGAGILYPIFEELGYFTKEEMKSMIQIGGNHSKLQQLFYPAFDFYGGSLGIGFGLAAGMAKGAKMNHERWKVYCILGDAECYEGSIWETMNFAGHQKLDNLIVIVDRNYLGCSDFTEHMVHMEPFKEKWISCNWDVYETDGHDIGALYDTMKEIKDHSHGRPQCIIAKTRKGQGLDYLVDKPLMHGYMPKGDEINRAFRSLK